MEYWEPKLKRAHETLSVWKLHFPALTVGGLKPADLEAFIDEFGQRAMAETEARGGLRAALHAKRKALAHMKSIGIAVPVMIEAQCSGQALLLEDLDALYLSRVKTEETTLKRLRELLPIWLRANAALAALTPPHPEIVRVVEGTTYTAQLAQELLDGYTAVVKAVDAAAQPVKEAVAAMRTLAATTDALNKRWYKLAKTVADEDATLANALNQITTERSTPKPRAIPITDLAAAGDDGLEVAVSYKTSRGRPAMTRLLRWMVEGVDADFVHSTPLTPGGDRIGPFPAGSTVQVVTEVSNGAGTRRSDIRSIALGK